MKLRACFRLLLAGGLSLALGSSAFALSATRARLATLPNASNPGQSVALTAEVDGLGGGPPTGSVTFSDGATGLGAVPLSTRGAGQATLAAGLEHSCALTSAGGVKCWGSNQYGQLGDGTTTDRRSPVNVVGLTTGVVAVAAGAGHSCALTDAGEVKCWGLNYFGQLGDGTGLQRITPTPVVGMASGIVGIAAYYMHSCAVSNVGAVKCWGLNLNGQVGDGSVVNRLSPRPVTGLASGARAVSVGQYHSCALTSTNIVKCWGSNLRGQLGDGTLVDHRTPMNVLGGSGVTMLSSGKSHNCVVTNTSVIKCWGENYSGQLGDGTNVLRMTPVAVAGMSASSAAVSAGDAFSCGSNSAGVVKCWGSNVEGELANGTKINSNVPVQASTLTSGVVALASGGSHAMAIRSGGSLRSWGANAKGQVGDGTIVTRLVPTQTLSFVGMLRARARLFVSTFASGAHALAVTYAGDVKHTGSSAAHVHNVQ